MFKLATALLIQLLTQPVAVDAMTFDPGEAPCSAYGDGLIGSTVAALGMCSSEYCCTKCKTSGGVTTCYGCSSGTQCNGDVFSCVGCYSGDSQCTIGSSGSNSCCD